MIRAVLIILALALSGGSSVAAPKIELEVVNRFRLLADEDEQRRYHADLEQRLICGAYKNKISGKFSKTCNKANLVSRRREGANFATRWTRKSFLFRDGFVHDLSRTVRIGVAGLANAKSARCEWHVNNEALNTQSCVGVERGGIKLGADRSAKIDVKVVVLDGKGKPVPVKGETFSIKDIVVATVGDSFLSGEGNPHLAHRLALGNADSPFFGKRSEWLDIRCHRSLFTGAAIAAERLARRVPTQSVTLLPLACSGAETDFGILGAYLGRETNRQAMESPGPNFGEISVDEVFQTRVLPTQIESLVRALCPGQVVGGSCDKQSLRPDLVIISTGGNEVGFGDIIRELAAGNNQPPATLAKKLSDLPAHYQKINEAIAKMQPRSVFAMSYLDPTQQFKKIKGKDKLVYCDDVKATLDDVTFVPRFATLLGFGITAKGAKAAQQEVVKPLNKHLADAASSFNWRLITLPDDVQQGHGFCSKQAAWFYGYGESLEFQGMIGSDTNELENNAEIGNVPSGAMHPNIFGHFNIAERVYSEFKTIGLRP